MFNKGTWLFGLGLLFILGGLSYYLISWQAHAASPFDVADEAAEGDDFLPILVPAGSGDTAEAAPTLAVAVLSTESDEQQGEGMVDVLGMVPDHLVIPSIFLDAPILPVHYKDIESGGEIYHQWRVPSEFAAGWQDESALLGLPGNTVLNGHHNAYGMVFKDLVKLTGGDLIIVRSGEVEFRYEVAAKLLLPERGQTLETRIENSRWLGTSVDERLTLVTCWPANSNTHRVLIIAYPEGTTPLPLVKAPIGD